MKLTNITNYIGLTNTTAKEPELPTEVPAVEEPQGPKEVYISWQDHSKVAPKHFKPSFLRSMIISGIVASFILAAMGEFFLILLILSVAFAMYALSTTPPVDIKYELSNYGLEVAGVMYKWREFRHFFFTTTTQIPMLAVDTVERIPGRLYIKMADIEPERLKEIFLKYIPYLKEEPLSSTDKAYYSILNKFNMSGSEEGSEQQS
jgi:hypothetical protein